MSDLTDSEACLKVGDLLVSEGAYGRHIVLGRISRVSDASVWIGGYRLPRKGLSDSSAQTRIPTEHDLLRLRVQRAQAKLAAVKVDVDNLAKFEAFLEEYES